MRVTPTVSEGLRPWKYNITFTDNDSAYVGIARSVQFEMKMEFL